MSEPAWLAAARQYVGLREIPGAPTEPVIGGWLKKLGAWWSDDATPWCGTFVAACMQEAGLSRPKHWYRAKGWLDWGRPCRPSLGAVVVFERTGGGHVGFAVGYDDARNAILVLGGNQGDAVNVRPFNIRRVIDYRWPSELPLPETSLPHMTSTASFSDNEA